MRVLDDTVLHVTLHEQAASLAIPSGSQLPGRAFSECTQLHPISKMTHYQNAASQLLGSISNRKYWLTALFLVALATVVAVGLGLGRVNLSPDHSKLQVTTSDLEQDAVDSTKNIRPSSSENSTLLSQPSPSTSKTCVTPTNSCQLSTAKTVGSTCFCSTPEGPRRGRVR